MTRRSMPHALVAWLWLMLAGAMMAACAGETDGGRLAIGDPAPDYTATTLNGREVSLDALEGGPVLLNVWATWCPPCREEMPGLQTLHDRFGEAGLEVVGVSVDRASAVPAIRDFVDQHGLTFRILHDPEERVARTFRTIGVPETFLLDADGRIAARWIGAFDPTSEATITKIRDVLGNGERMSGAGTAGGARSGRERAPVGSIARTERR